MDLRRRALIGLATGAVVFGILGAARATACTSIAIPAVITAPGVYCLSADALYGGSAPAVDVRASGTEVDFSGYRLHWNGASAPLSPAVTISAASENVLVRNGLISGFTIAVDTSGPGTIVEDMRMNNNDMGIWVHDGSPATLIRRNFVRFGGGVVVDAGNSGSVRVVDNDFYGRSTTSNAVGSQGVQISGTNTIVSRNRFGRLYIGISFTGAGKYQGNLTSNVTVPFSGGTDAGDND